MTVPEIHGPEPLELAGRHGWRYWVHHPYPFLERSDVDPVLSSFPLVVFTPDGDPATTPVVIGLQGMAAPYQWNAFLIPHLLDLGIACVLFDTPLAGERSLIRDQSGDVMRQMTALVERGVTLTAHLVRSMFEATARDFTLVREILHERHGLTDSRVALFGISLGCLLSSFAFLRDGHGQRLLGAIGHADLQAFAKSYAPYLTPLLSSSPAWLVARTLVPFVGAYPQASVEFLAVLGELSNGSEIVRAIDPMRYADRAVAHRPMRFLVGADDNLLRADDAMRCAGVLPNGDCYIVPGMSHGESSTELSFEDHVRYYLATQLRDWSRAEAG